jgi:TonB-linked SusC/RagA family outer membrane protein
MRSQKTFNALRTVFILFIFQLFVLSVAAQPLAITGTITDEDGESIIGANIIIKGTTIGTITDINGIFNIEVDDPNATLVISFVGYSTREIIVSERADWSITLAEDMVGLDEVVVVGYGTQKKVNLTGSVGVADGEVLEDRPIANAGEGLQGVIPNFNISIRSGDPSGVRGGDQNPDERALTDFNVRGYESINGGAPLILIDGVPGNLNRLNPNDIASVSVLKDAAASAVYGARAAFGVVLVETKKGKGRKANVTFGAEFGWAKPIFLMDPVTDPYQFALARNKATQRTSGSDSYNEQRLGEIKQWVDNPTKENEWTRRDGTIIYNGYNDYQNRLLIDFAPQQKYDFNVSGASESASYYVSFGYLNKDGYLDHPENNENFKRYNVLLKGDFRVNKWLSVDSRALISTEVSDTPHFYHWDVNINTSARQNPLDPIEFPDLDWYLTPGDRAEFEQYIGKYFGSTSFFEYLENGGRKTFTRTNLTLTQGVTLTPIKGLNIRGDFSYSLYNRSYQDVQSKVNVIRSYTPDLATHDLFDNGFSGNDWIRNVNDHNQYFVLNTYADYTIDKGSHYFKAMVGFNQEWGTNQMIRAQAFSLITPQITDLNATVGAQETQGSKSHVALRGVFYRVNYIFNDRYLIEANGRYDGTSRFPKDDRFGFFPSFSAGWRISEEAFMSGTSSWLDNLKLRASYGTLGNQLLGSDYYPYIPSMGIGSSPIMFSAGQRSPYVSAAGLVSPTLTWETVVTQNLGVDFTMLGNRLDFSFDIYNRDTKDMLMNVTYPDILGTGAPDANAADRRTSGWEIAATWRTRINTDWNYGVTLALSDNKSEITKFDNPTGSLDRDEYRVGMIIGERWGYETLGIFQTEAEVSEHADQSQLGANWRPGDMKYADLNGDGEINEGEDTFENPGDQKIIAYEEPRYNFGINGNLGWKNFSLTLFFQGTLKQDYWPPNGNWVAFYPFNAGHVENYYLTDTWSPENPNAYFAHPHESTSTKQNIVPQTRYVQNAAYIRLKTLTLTYNLPTEWAGKVGMQNARVYFSGLNMWEYTTMRKPLDPEVRPTLTQEYYKQRIYSIGLNVTF